ncbi:MAG: hypothetical protein Q7J54_00510 [Candidatus Woesearchaeota archaeon]|nr:hypothetical protein [Candidatus Woesearchaeota archaeon]
MVLKDLKYFLSSRFALTYLGAVSSVFIVIAILSSFGFITDNGKEKYACLFSENLGCLDYKITSTATTIFVENKGSDIVISNVQVEGCEKKDENLILKGGERLLLSLDNCKTEESGKNVERGIEIKYVDASGNGGTITGNVIAVVE